MTWHLEFSPQALKFMSKQHIAEHEITEKVTQALRKFEGCDMNIDIIKLHGIWAGFHRIRLGKVRIMVAFSFEQHMAFIKTIDFRGNAYK